MQVTETVAAASVCTPASAPNARLPTSKEQIFGTTGLTVNVPPALAAPAGAGTMPAPAVTSRHVAARSRLSRRRVAV